MVGHAPLGVGGTFTVFAFAEEAFEDPSRIGLGSHGIGRTFPSEIVLVGAGVTGVAGAGAAIGDTAHFQRREASGVADFAGNGLVDGNAGADVGGALFDADAGEEYAVAASVIAAAIFAWVGIELVQTT